MQYSTLVTTFSELTGKSVRRSGRRNAYKGTVQRTNWFLIPDINYAANSLSHFNENPVRERLMVAKGVRPHLKRTQGLGIVCKGDENGLSGFADADWG